MTTSTKTAAQRTIISPGRPGRAAMAAAGVAAIAMGIFQVASGGPTTEVTYSEWTDYARDLLLLAYLVASIVAVRFALEAGEAPRHSGWLIPTGYGLIAIGVTVGVLTREELDWFFVVAGPGLLLSAIGFVIWAVWSRRNGVFPTWQSVLLGIGGVFAILFAEVGSSVLIGSFWLFLLGHTPGASRS